jgi:hypothetical protein
VTTFIQELRRGVAMAATLYAGVIVVHPLELGTVAQYQPTLLSNNIDRSKKGNRLTPVAPSATNTVMVGCERPFSSLTTVSSSEFSMRCLT